MTMIKPPTLREIMEHKGSLSDAIEQLQDSGYSLEEIGRNYPIPFYLLLLYANKYKPSKSITKFIEVVKYFQKISSMRSVRGKGTEVAKFLNLNVPFSSKIRLVLAKVSDKPYGTGDSTLLEIIRLSQNMAKHKMDKLWIDYGEIGDICNLVVPDKEPTLTLHEVYSFLGILPSISKYRKVMGLVSLFRKCNTEEAEYLARLLRKRLYLGVPSQVLITAVSRNRKVSSAYLTDACLLTGNLKGLLLAEFGDKRLKQVQVRVGSFITPELATLFDQNRVRYPCRVEEKYDGVRIQAHKKGSKIWLFTRAGNLKNNAYPEIIKMVLNIQTDNCILDGEVVGIENGKIIPFQKLLKRTSKKKYEDITGQDITLSVRWFDLLYHDGKSLINQVYDNRLGMLRALIKPELLAEGKTCRSFSEIMAIYDGLTVEEGLMVKDLASKYQSGRHTGWQKLKQGVDTIDCVITMAKWGKGRRSGFLASYRIAIRDDVEKKLFEIGDVGGGFSDNQLESFTQLMTPLAISKTKEGILVQPKIVIEVSCLGILKSKTYSSGFSLRSPNFLRRRDKTISMIDTLSSLKEKYRLRNGT